MAGAFLPARVGGGGGDAIASRSRQWPSSQSRPSACKSRWTALSRGSGTPSPSSAPRDKISALRTNVPGGREQSSNGGGSGGDGSGCSSSPPVAFVVAVVASSSSLSSLAPGRGGLGEGGDGGGRGGGGSLMAGVVFRGCGGYYFGVCL
jgi:hypothetical protein